MSTETECRERWANLLTAFRASLRNRAAGLTEKIYYLHDEMAFLLDEEQVEPEANAEVPVEPEADAVEPVQIEANNEEQVEQEANDEEQVGQEANAVELVEPEANNEEQVGQVANDEKPVEPKANTGSNEVEPDLLEPFNNMRIDPNADTNVVLSPSNTEKDEC